MALIEKHSSITFSHPGFFVPVKRLQRNLETGRTDVHFRLGTTPEREQVMHFAEPMYAVHCVSAGNADDRVSI